MVINEGLTICFWIRFSWELPPPLWRDVRHIFVSCVANAETAAAVAAGQSDVLINEGGSMKANWKSHDWQSLVCNLEFESMAICREEAEKMFRSNARIIIWSLWNELWDLKIFLGHPMSSLTRCSWVKFFVGIELMPLRGTRGRGHRHLFDTLKA